jgi:hypothetical protein
LTPFLRRRLIGLSFVAALTLVTLAPRPAHAYAWMIRHGFAGCAQCHFDPSGGGLLNDFGYGAAGDYLASHYGSGEASDAQPFFGLWTNPKWLLASAAFRDMLLFSKPNGASYSSQNILMQADIRAGIDLGHLRAAGSLGVITLDHSPASIAGNLVAREYWAGWSFAGDNALVRVGRMNLPYGVRSIEHTLFVRQATRTDLNDTQQDGLAFAARGHGFRGEIMGIAGNYQMSPDAFRERGYAGYVEWSPLSRWAFGVSSEFTHASEDVYLRTATTRQAYGVILRGAPTEAVAVLGEADATITAPSGLSTWTGLATMLQVDVEPWQGLHFIGTGESWATGQPSTGTSWGGWGSIDWFFIKHFDARFDYVHWSLVQGPTRVPVDSFLLQIHVFL